VKIRPAGAELFYPDKETDGRTDRQDEVNSSWFNFANAHKNKITLVSNTPGFCKSILLSKCYLTLHFCYLEQQIKMATEHGNYTDSVSQSKISVSVPLRSLRASHRLIRDRKMISAVRASDSPPEPWRSFLAKRGESSM
jgi:hypothetical protein